MPILSQYGADPTGAGGVVGGLDSVLEVGLSAGLAALVRSLFPAQREGTWSLHPDDPVLRDAGLDLYLAGQGPPDRFDPVKNVNVAVGGGFMGFDPSTHPTGAQPLGFQVEQVYVADNRDVDLSPIKDVLDALTKRHPQTGRPPRMRVKYGPWDEAVWVQSYSLPMLGLWPGTDRPVGFRLSLTLTVARTHTLKRATLPGARRETTWHKLASGETYELVAGLYYRDPSLGVLLRRINPTVLEESPGDVIKVLDLDHPSMRQAVTPTAPCFLQDRAAQVQALADARADWGGKTFDAMGPYLTTVQAGTPTLYEGA